MPDPINVADSLNRLRIIESQLCTLLIEREEVVRAALLALLCKENLVVVGPPGTAKSQLITQLARCVGDATGNGLRCFVYLLTKFSTPEELFGPISLSGMKVDDYRRITTGKLPEAELAFLDEIFKASSAILNNLLRLMNEGEFENGRQTMQVPLISLFGASNELPQEAELEALFDRFLLRLTVDYVSEGGFTKLQAMLAQHQTSILQETISKVELAALQQAAAAIPLSSSVLDAIAQLRRDLTAKGIRLSDRRWGKTHGVLRAHALLEGRAAMEEDDLMILKHVLWTAPDQQPDVSRLCARIGNPINGKATELTDQAASVFDATLAAHQQGRDTQEKVSIVAEGIDKFKSIHATLAQLQEQAFAQGRPTEKIEKAIGSVLTMREKVGALILGAM